MTSQGVMYSSLPKEAAEWRVCKREGIGPEEKCKRPSPDGHGDSPFPYYNPLGFQHHHAHHYRCQKLCVEYELWIMGVGWGGGGGGVTRRCVGASILTGRGAVRAPLRPGGPHRCPHYAGSCSMRRRAHGEERCDFLPLPPILCLPVTAPIGKTAKNEF